MAGTSRCDIPTRAAGGGTNSHLSKNFLICCRAADRGASGATHLPCLDQRLNATHTI